MPEFLVPILSVETVTHDVKAYRVERPAGYAFEPGQATEVAVAREGWEAETRPFTFTSRTSDAWLEFTIKSYRDHDGVTKLLDTLVPGDRLILHDVWGALTYQGPGLFLAGGAGITPFLSVFRDLKDHGRLAGDRLVFSNKTAADVIRETELRSLLGDNFISLLSQTPAPGHRSGMIDAALLAKELSLNPAHIYLCGPDPMMDAVSELVKREGFGDRLIVED
jgi:ferredoxin-NADP reductase